MTDHAFGTPVSRVPVVTAPAPFVERRTAFRREADRLAYRETALLARSLDVLVSGTSADLRLAGVLDLLAETAGARRAAILAGGQDERRIAVACVPGEPPDEARALGSWLDAWAPRARAHRAAAGQATVLVVGSGERFVEPSGGRAAAPPDGPRHYACLPIPAARDAALGFDFENEAAAARLADRLPPQLARHAAVALALVTDQLARELETRALRAREEERDRYVSTVAHELRTPLTGLSGYLELILGGQVADPADERDFLERSRQIVESMGELVGDLLELSRLDSGSLRLEVAPFSLAEAVTRVVESLTPIALSRDLELCTELPPRLRSAGGDRRRVEQILTNLAGNAMKFAPPGSAIELRGWFAGPVAVVAVRDEGGGIGAADRERIFDRFHRLAGHERIVGTGLGLPIARDLARSMGGELDVASVPGAGSCFILALPGVAGADASQIASAVAAAVAAEETRLEERAVLRALAASPRPRLVAASPLAGGWQAAGQAAGRAHLRAVGGGPTRDTDGAPA